MRKYIFILLVLSSFSAIAQPGITMPGNNSPRYSFTELYRYNSGSFKRYLDSLETAALISGLGSGTVSNFSFTNANGFTGVVTNPTTTPTLSLTMQDANGSQSGLLTASTQTIGGVKTFNGNIVINNGTNSTVQLQVGTGTGGYGWLYANAGGPTNRSVLRGYYGGAQTYNLDPGTFSWINTGSPIAIGSGTNNGGGAILQVTGRASVSTAPANSTDVIRLADTSIYIPKDWASGIYTITGARRFTGSVYSQGAGVSLSSSTFDQTVSINSNTGFTYVNNGTNGDGPIFRANRTAASFGNPTTGEKAAIYGDGTIKAVLNAYSSGTVLPVVYNSTNDRFETTSTVAIRPMVKTASNVTLARSTDYAFNGTTATFTLPAINASFQGGTYQITIKNRGSGNLTINSNSGGNDIYTTSAVATETIAPGAAVTYIQDDTYWNHE